MINAQSAAQEALELRDALVIGCKHYEEKLAHLARSPEESIADARADVRAIGQTLPLSQIVIWTQTMMELSSNGAQRVFAGNQVPEFDGAERPEWWVFQGFSIATPECFADLGLPPDAIVKEILIVPEPRRLLTCFTFYSPSTDPSLPLFRVGQITSGRLITPSIELTILGAREFMRSTVGAREPIMLPRATRRRMQREHKDLPDIRIVALRRAESAGRESNATRVYRYQHIVSGHWRHLNQPRKSDGAAFTFVHAHIKGPKGAPLLRPREAVHVVAR